MSEPIKSDQVSIGEEEEQEYNETTKPETLEAGDPIKSEALEASDPIKPEPAKGGEDDTLKRSLRSRHLQMIAIGALRSV